MYFYLFNILLYNYELLMFFMFLYQRLQDVAKEQEDIIIYEITKDQIRSELICVKSSLYNISKYYVW